MNDTQLTIAGNLVDDPELRYTPIRAARSPVPDRVHPTVLRQAERPVEGRRHAVPHGQRLASGPLRTLLNP